MGYADAAEDAWIMSQFPRDFVGVACEVGAFDGSTGSVTLSLQDAGWTTLAIEANPDCEPAIEAVRPLYRMCACGPENLDDQDFHIHLPGAAGYSSLVRPTHKTWHADPNAEWKTVKVKVRTLDSVLEEVGFDHLDALSIDVEGGEMGVLRGFTFSRWRPKCVVIESWDEQSEVAAWMADRNYHRVDRRNVNDLFLRRDVDS